MLPFGNPNCSSTLSSLIIEITSTSALPTPRTAGIFLFVAINFVVKLFTTKKQIKLNLPIVAPERFELAGKKKPG
jgi:hypothetical protein